MIQNSSESARRQLAAILIAGFAGFAIPVSTAAENLGAFLLVVLALWMGRSEDWKVALRHPFVIASLCFFAVFLLGIIHTSVPERAPRMLGKLYPYFFAPAFFVASRNYLVRRAVIAGFVLAAALSLALSVLSALIGKPIAQGIEGNWYVFKSHTYHNMFVAWMVVGVLALLLTRQLTGRLQVLAWAVVALGVVDILFLVQGRTGHVILLASSLLLLLLWNPRKGMLIGLVIVLVGLPLVWSNSNVLRERFERAHTEVLDFSARGGQETAIGMRLSWYGDAVQIVRQAPLLGHGTGSFETEFRRFKGETLDLDKAVPPLSGTRNPHNDYLWVAIEVGVVGVLAMLALFFMAIRTSSRLPREQHWMVCVIVGSIALGTLMNSMVTDNVAGTGFMILLCALLAGPLNAPDTNRGLAHA